MKHACSLCSALVGMSGCDGRPACMASDHENRGKVHSSGQPGNLLHPIKSMRAIPSLETDFQFGLDRVYPGRHHPASSLRRHSSDERTVLCFRSDKRKYVWDADTVRVACLTLLMLPREFRRPFASS